MKWHDDPLMQSMPHRRKVLQICICTAHLATGSTLLCRGVKAGTIKQHTHDVARFIACVGQSCPIDPRKTEDQMSFHPMLSKIFAELERWEKAPNRREPFAPEMLMSMKDATIFGAHSADSAWSACHDFFELGLHLGLRRGEWAQEDGATLDKPALNQFSDAKAFCSGDFRFELATRHRVRGMDMLLHPVEKVRKCWVKFRTQKNGENGEERLITRRALKAVCRILQRFQSLRGNDDTAAPVAIFRDADGSIQPIRSSLIESTMRRVASQMLGLDLAKHKEDLQRWSSHSLRVGACALLHGAGFSTADIKFLLRWKSDAFLMHLRNVTLLSDKQAEAFDRFAEMPDLL